MPSFIGAVFSAGGGKQGTCLVGEREMAADDGAPVVDDFLEWPAEGLLDPSVQAGVE